MKAIVRSGTAEGESVGENDSVSVRTNTNAEKQIGDEKPRTLVFRTAWRTGRKKRQPYSHFARQCFSAFDCPLINSSNDMK